MAKNIDKEEVVEEVETKTTKETTKEKVVEKQPKVKETTKKEVKEDIKETKAQDKYAESKTKDPDKSYDVVEKILANSTISDTGKIEKISKEAHVSYKTIIEAFRELDSGIKEGLYASEPNKHAKLVGNLYRAIRQAITNKDKYVSLLQLKMILVLFRVYKDTISIFGSFCVYCPEFNGTEQDYEDYQYCITTVREILVSIDNNRLDTIDRRINFSKPEFKSGQAFEELYKSLI